MRRVVVTGLGCVSPLGNSVEETWAGLKAGKCGIDTITRYDNTNFKVKYDAEVKDFDASKYTSLPLTFISINGVGASVSGGDRTAEITPQVIIGTPAEKYFSRIVDNYNTCTTLNQRSVPYNFS